MRAEAEEEPEAASAAEEAAEVDPLVLRVEAVVEDSARRAAVEVLRPADEVRREDEVDSKAGPASTSPTRIAFPLYSFLLVLRMRWLALPAA